MAELRLELVREASGCLSVTSLSDGVSVYLGELSRWESCAVLWLLLDAVEPEGRCKGRRRSQARVVGGS